MHALGAVCSEAGWNGGNLYPYPTNFILSHTSLIRTPFFYLLHKRGNNESLYCGPKWTRRASLWWQMSTEHILNDRWLGKIAVVRQKNLLHRLSFRQTLQTKYPTSEMRSRPDIPYDPKPRLNLQTPSDWNSDIPPLLLDIYSKLTKFIKHCGISIVTSIHRDISSPYSD
jgi:hypothetical protein